MKIFLYGLFVSVLLLFAHLGQAQVIFSDTTKKIDLGKYVSILEDPKNSLSIEQVLSSPHFERSNHDVPNLGVGPSSYWIKFDVTNTTSSGHLFLELAYPIMDEVILHTIRDGKVVHTLRTGDQLPFDQRDYKHQNFIFNLSCPQNELQTVLLKVKSNEQILVPLSISSSQTLFESNLVKDLIFGIYAGIILSMFCYNIFIFFTIKDYSYLYYVIYIIFIGFTQASLFGYTFRYLVPNMPMVANSLITIFPSFAGIGLAMFMEHFLKVRENAPKLSYILYLFIGLYVTALITNLFGFFSLSYNIVDIDAALITLFALIIGIYFSFRGNRSAKFFLLAWVVFLLGIIIFVLRNFGILPSNDFTNYTMTIGSALETIMLSFALADRINILKKEKEASQIQAIEALEENKRLITHQNIVLEKKVAQRTSELENAYKDLKEAEMQLINSEKMASLGQLTAGIAHEINNPINFVVSNIMPLKRDLDDLQALLGKYEQISLEDDLTKKLAEIEKFKTEIDIDFTKQEIQMLLRGISEGASRTAEIVRSLKNFSRVDESDLKMANINEGVLSTLVLLNQQLEGIELIKSLGDLPQIECYPGKLNQVFMNILTNGIEILKSHPIEGRKPSITISTSLEGENVIIRIKDNGIGMPEEVKNKIFDPFFTTKDVGKGTGLGLSISYGIIEKHKGSLEVLSAPNEGAEFVITLPIKADLGYLG